MLGGTRDDTLDAARSALLEATSTPPARCSTIAFDVSDEAACVAAVAEVARRHGRSPDILVNNAGINHRSPLSDFSTERFNHVLRTNLNGPFVLSRECAKGMAQRGWGRIVNVGSIMGEIGRNGMHAYVASKHGVHGLTKCLAAELGGSGVTCNALAPGYIGTDLTSKLQRDPSFNAQITSRTPVGRWGTPREMAGPAVFLCSDAASYVNGVSLVADGGMIETFHYGALGPMS